MHQPNKLPHLNDSPTVTRGNRPPKQQSKKSLAAKPTSSASTTIGVNQLQQPRVQQLPRRAPAPVWLKSLIAAQKVSMVLFGSVFGLSSIVYRYTMHTQTTWRTQQEQLRKSQNQERQQGVMNEQLKQDLAKRAEAKGSGLVAPKPEMVVFVQGAAPRQPKLVPPTTQTPQQIPATKIPSGY